MTSENRFHDNPSGAITDTKFNLQWLPKDSWQDLGKWLDWEGMLAYRRLVNQFYAGGASDWRFPTKEEILAFHLDDLCQNDFEGQEAHIHPLFVRKCAYYMWSGDTDENGRIFRINLRTGETDCIDKTEREFQAVRLVRDLKR